MSWAVNFDESVWALVLLGALFVALLPTGYSAAFLPWFVVEMAGASWLLWCCWREKPGVALDAWRAAGPLSAWLGLSAAIAAIQIATGNTESYFDTFRQFHFFAGGFLAVPLAARAFPAFRPSWRRVWVGALASALLVALLVAGMYRGARLGPGGELLTWWPFVYRNHYAAFILLVAPALCWLGLNEREARWSSAAGVAAGIAGVISAGSRSGIVLLAITLAGMLAVWISRTGEKRRAWGLGFAVAVLAVGAAFADPDLIVWRLKNAGALLDGRAEYWRATLRMVMERPWLGWGFGTWPEVYTQFLIRDSGLVVNHAHSDWLEYLAEGGAIPFLALIALFVRGLWLGLRHPWALGVPALMVFAMADYPLRLPIVLLVLLCLHVSAEEAERSLAAGKASRVATRPRWLRIVRPFRGVAVPDSNSAVPIESGWRYSEPEGSAARSAGRPSLAGSGITRIIVSTRCWYAFRRLYTRSFS